MANNGLRFKLDGIALAYLAAFVVIGLLLFMWLFPLILPQAVTLAIAGLAVGVLGWLVFMVWQHSEASSPAVTTAANPTYRSSSPAAPVTSAPAASAAPVSVAVASKVATPAAAVAAAPAARPAPAASSISAPPAAPVVPAPATAKPVHTAIPAAAKSATPKAAASGPATKSAPAKPAKPAPVTSAPTTSAPSVASTPAAAAAPKALFDVPAGPADDLKLISGVGPVLEKKMNAIGITTFAQVARLTSEQTSAVEGHLGFAGRIERDEWVKQAEVLARGGAAEYERVFGKKPR